MKVQGTAAEKKAFETIDREADTHLERIQAFVRIPSIAAEDMEGVRRCATFVRTWFRDLGCRDTPIFETRGSPVVYGHYDAGATTTVLVYFMYDVQQVSGETWTMIRDPFDPQVLPMVPFRKVLVGRGAVNSKGPMGAFLNALSAVRASGGEVPVNLTFVAEGEEELGSMHLIEFVQAERARGYPDIQVVDTSSELSDDWSRTDPDAGVVALVREAYEAWGYRPQVWPFMLATSPQYLWTKVLGIPYVAVGLGHGGRAHAPDEYYVIEGDGGKHPVAGLGEAEKFYVHVLLALGGRKLG